MNEDAHKPARRSWRFRFSLRTLFAIVTLLAIYIGFQARRAQDQRRIVEQIEKIGGTVEYDYQYGGYREPLMEAEIPGPKWLRTWIGDDYFIHVVEVQFARDVKDVIPLPLLQELRKLPHLETLVSWTTADEQNIGDDAMPYVAQIRSLRTLRLNGPITDRGIARLAPLKSLEWLMVIGTDVSDKCMPTIAGFQQLRRLHLANTDITDSGISRLSTLTQLEELNAEGTKVTDEGLATIAMLTNLTELHLQQTAITDAGLKHLARLSKLERLYLSNTAVSDEGLRHLSAMPKLIQLNLDGTKVTGVGAKHLKRIFYIDLSGCQISDEAASEIANLKGLQYLGMRDAQISPQASKLLQSKIHFELE